jgi:VWFA-related protein
VKRLLLAVVVAAIHVAPGRGQQPVFRSGVDMVRVDVSVMNGVRPVTGLTVDHFTVTDNGTPQKLESVSLDRVPLNLTLVLDVSGSMGGRRMAGLIDAATSLVSALRDDDKAALLEFWEPVRLKAPATTNRSALLAAIQRLEPAGATALNDAIFFGLQLRAEDADARQVALVFSDGRDTSSWLAGEQVIEVTRRSGVLVHVVELAENRRASRSRFLDELASAGGGRSWLANDADDLKDLFGNVLDELRSRYLLSYYASGVTREGWHDVKVTLKGARGDVTARPGYYVPPR